MRGNVPCYVCRTAMGTGGPCLESRYQSGRHGYYRCFYITSRDNMNVIWLATNLTHVCYEHSLVWKSFVYTCTFVGEDSPFFMPFCEEILWLCFYKGFSLKFDTLLIYYFPKKTIKKAIWKYYCYIRLSSIPSYIFPGYFTNYKYFKSLYHTLSSYSKMPYNTS